MKIERLERYLSEMKKGIPNPGIGFDDIGKLIAVAKAAKECIARCQCCSDLIDAVDDLEASDDAN